MLNAGRVAGDFCNRYIGWSRIGFLVSAFIIIIAVVVLVRILRDIEVGEVVQALKETETRDIALAALFVAFGYFADLLRPVRAAHDRALRYPLPGGGARRLHQLRDRS